MLVWDLSPHLNARLVCSCLTDWPLGFGAWRQRGSGSEYVRLRGSMWDRLILLCVTLSCISCLLLCIVLYVIYVWLWDLCDMCPLYFHLYIMSLVYAHLLCFRVTLQFKWVLCYVLLLHSFSFEYIMWTWYAWTCSNPCDLIATSSCKPSGWKPQISLIHILEVVLSSITKNGEIESI